MSKVTARIPSGFGEYLPNDQLEFNRLKDIIRSTYEKYGFSPIDTPDIELSDVLLAKVGGETEQEIYRFERGKNDLSLRFDLTVPLIRYVAEHENDLVFPFKCYQIGKVHRGERAQAGRFREFYQCDIDTIGSNSPTVDAEFPAIINEIFERFNFGEFTIHISDRRILSGFLQSIGLGEKSTAILRIVDKIDKIGDEKTKGELAEAGLTREQVSQIFDFISTTGSNDEIIERVSKTRTNSEMFTEGVEKLKSLVENLRIIGVPEHRLKVNLKIVRGLDYYTGAVYETTLNDYPEIGSVCSGGRYDNLAACYTDTDLPGVGISIGLTRLFYKLREAGIIKPEKNSPVDVVVMPLEDPQTAYAIKVAKTLRESGIGSVLYSEKTPAKKKFRFADRMGFKYAILVGDREANSQTVSLKDMLTGNEKSIPISEITEQFKK